MTNDNPTKIQQIIKKSGGQTAFSKECNIPLRTVQDWARGVRRPPAWVVELIEKSIK